MGVLGLSPKEFYSLSWREYILLKDGFEIKRCHDAEHTRIMTYTLASIHRPPDKPWPSIREYWPLKTDGKKVDLKNTEEAKKLRKLLKEAQKQMSANV